MKSCTEVWIVQSALVTYQLYLRGIAMNYLIKYLYLWLKQNQAEIIERQ